MLSTETKKAMKKDWKQTASSFFCKHKKLWFWGIGIFIVILIIVILLLLPAAKENPYVKVLQSCLSDMNISEDMTELAIPDGRCNNVTVDLLSFSVFSKLTTLQVGSNCFQNVLDVSVAGMSVLAQLVVGENSFTKRIGSLSVTNCPSLTELSIGDGSFTSFSKLTIASTDVLQSIVIGSHTFTAATELRLNGLSGLSHAEIGSDSFTLEDGSFHVSACPSLQVLMIGAHSFEKFTTFEVQNDPALEAIQIGSLTNSSSFSSASLELKGLSTGTHE